MITNKFHTLDKIVTDKRSYEKMSEWYYDPKNDDVIKSSDVMDIPFLEGIIVHKVQGIELEELEKVSYMNQLGSLSDVEKELEEFNKKELHLYFNIKEDITCYQYEYDKNDKKYSLIAKVVVDETFAETDRLSVEHEFKNVKVDDEELQKIGKNIVRTMMMTLKYISNYKNDMKVSEKRVSKIKKAKSKGGKPKSNKKRTVNISAKTYSFYSDEEIKEKRKYEKQAESWRVRGHWRYYQKTGKRVWVKPYVKGEGEIEAKEYRV